MLSKEELLTKDISELENIAQSLGVTNEFDDDKEGLIMPSSIARRIVVPPSRPRH